MLHTPLTLHDGLGYKLTIAARTNNASFEANLASLGLTRQMWCVLVAVGEQNITAPSAIAAYIGIIRPAASRTLKQMEKSGLLQRSNGSTDRRTTCVVLTESGKSLLARSLPLARQNRAELHRSLTRAEQETLAALLDKLTRSLQTTAPGV